MKKVTFFLMMLIASIGLVQALDLPINFESTPVTGDFINFDGGTATVISNPQSSGINTSATVAQMVRNGGAAWAGSKLLLATELDFSANGGISMKVFTSAPIGTKITFKLENETNAGINKELHAFTTVTGTWETLTWDFTGETASYKWLVFLFDLGNVGDGTATSTFLFDDIQQYEITQSTDATLNDLKVGGTTISGFNAATFNYIYKLPEGTTTVPTVTYTINDAAASAIKTDATGIPGTTSIVVTAEDGSQKTYTIAFSILVIQTYPIDFETGPYVLAGFDGGLLTWELNTQKSGINTTDSVAKMIKGAGQGWAGGHITLSSNIDFSTKNGFSMKVFSPRVGASVLFKLEGSVGPVEKTATTTLANTWETLNFDFTGATTDVYNKIVLIFDLGTVGDGSADYTFLIDDINHYEILISSDATLSDLKVDGTTVTGFNANTLTYNVKLPVGTTAVPVVAATKNQAGATVSITQATALPGTATVLVTAEDASTKTYTLNFSVLVPQVLPVTFEAEPYDITNFDGGALTVIANPHATGNASAKVGQIIKGAGSGAAGSYITLTSNIDFSVKPTISLKVYSPRVGAKILVKLEGSVGPTERSDTSTVANAWETFTFDFTGAASNVYNKIVFIFDLGAIGDGSANFTFLIDDIEQAGTIAGSDATLSNLKIDSTSISNFNSDTISYSVELPYGTTAVPVVTVTATDSDATAVITAASAIPGTTSIVVTAEDGTTTKTYTVAFTIAAPKTVATLSDIKIDGTTIRGFSASKLNYVVSLAQTTTVVPTLTCTTTDSTATKVITAATSIPGTTKIVVTAQDGVTTKTYTVVFTTSPTYNVSFTVVNHAQAPLADAQVVFLTDTLVTDINGFVEFASVSPTTSAAYSVSKTGYVDVTGSLAIVDADVSKKVTLEIKTYTVTFTVVDINSIALADAEVVFLSDTLKTDISGMVEFTSVSPTTSAAYTVSKAGYVDVSDSLAVIDANVAKTITLELLKTETYSVTFTVVDENEVALADAEVIFNDTSISTDVNGVAIFTSVLPKTDAEYTITKEGFVEASGKVTITDADVDLKIQLIGVGISNKTSIVSNLYPNPTNGLLNIQLASDVSEATVELFDLNGKMVYKTSFNSLETTLDLSENKSGIYLIKVITEHNLFNEKIVLSK